MQKNGGAEKHIKERIRRATIAMKQAWSIGERLFEDDYKRRLKMFRALVESVALYGAEIWGWGNDTRIDGIKRKYVKWILGLDRGTPNDIVAEETKIEELRTEALKRAIRYEEKTRKKEKKIILKCVREIDKKRTGNEEIKWEKKRREGLEKIGMKAEELQKRREKETRVIIREIMEKLNAKEKEERRWKNQITTEYTKR